MAGDKLYHCVSNPSFHTPTLSCLEKLLQLPRKIFFHVSMVEIKANVLHVRPSVRMHMSASPNGQISVKRSGGDRRENISAKSKFAEIGHKYRIIYIYNWVAFIFSFDTYRHKVPLF